MTKICPISNYEIITNDDWNIYLDNPTYKIEISIIGNNILHTKNYGYATIEHTEKSWPIINKVLTNELKCDKYFIVHDYSEYKGANAKVRIEYIKWIKEHEKNILGVYIYNTNNFTKILLNTGKLLLKGFEKSHFLNNYEETILSIKQENEKNNHLNTNNNKIEFILEDNANFKTKNNHYSVKKVWKNSFKDARFTTYLINDNIIIRKFGGFFEDDTFGKLAITLDSILTECNIKKYHFYIRFEDDFKMSIKFRKDAIKWYANNYNIITSGFYNLSLTNRIIIRIAKTLIDTSVIKSNFIINNLNEIFTTIENYSQTSNNVIDSKNNYKLYSKKQLIKALTQSENEKAFILKNQQEEINKLFNKLGRISWDENYNFNENDFDISNSEFSELNNAIIVIQNDIKEILQKRDDLILKAEESEKLKSAFLANMSHEIRTPMNSIIGFSDILNKLIKDEKQKGFLDIIISSSTHLLNVINNIIDMSKIQSGTYSLYYSEFDISALIKEVINELKILKPTININFNNNKLEISADKTRLKQVFINLLNNAIKYTNKGSISIEFNIEKENILFSVKDTGIGIPDNEIESIFNRFRQANSSKSLNSINNGAGLGLTISKKLIELHNGKIWVESEENVGSTFYFTLPISTIVK